MGEEARWAELETAAQQILDQLDPRRRWRVVDAGPGDDLGRIDIQGRAPDGGRWEQASVHFPLSDPWPETIAWIASELQDYVVESGLQWGAAAPKCPGHRHPADPVTVEGTAVWVCPATHAVLRPVLA
ncbi:hypothetical protein [Microlunatus sp. GCM10028923]|uniref:hypothetical protein n=1 Tax=Microlunatus sp. GCM10028923 TaxID=3273400 RepID=UPI003620D262